MRLLRRTWTARTRSFCPIHMPRKWVVTQGHDKILRRRIQHQCQWFGIRQCQNRSNVLLGKRRSNGFWSFWRSTCTAHHKEIWECHSCISKTTAQLERLALTKSHCCGYMLILQRCWMFSCWTSTPFIQSEQAIPNKCKELHQNDFLDDVAAHHITSPLGCPYCHASNEKSGAAIADGLASNSLACPVSKSICKPRTAAYSALKGQGSARRPTTKPKASCGKIWPAWHGGMAHQQTQEVFQKKFKMIKVKRILFSGVFLFEEVDLKWRYFFLNVICWNL